MSDHTGAARRPCSCSILLPASAAIAALILAGCSSGESSDPSKAPSPPPTSSSNAPPTISGAPPASTKIGEAWSFTPTASDPDGDTLSFSIENQPAWADFDAMTGTLQGEPQAGDEGDYSSITITVSDGQVTDSLIFSVSVSQVASGLVTLSWEPPTMNDDGSPLIDLMAFKIYHGKSAGAYTEEILVENPGITTFVVENLLPGTYYFVVTALNSEGVESNYSDVASITIQ